MEFRQKYDQAFESLTKQIKKRSEKGIYTAMGYTSNLDILCDFQVEKLNELLAATMQGADLTQMKVAAMITSQKELLESVVYYCINGIGGEVDIQDPELVKETFAYKNGMGGTAVQAALALAMIGGPSIVHLTDDSKEVCDQLVSPYVRVALEDGTLGGAEKMPGKNPQECHFIIQFKKGDVIRLGDQAIPIPCSNRLILTKNTVNETLPFWTPYFEWIENHADQVSTNVLSSFNSILDIEILKERLKYLKGHVERYHKNNPEGIVYFEDAHYHSYAIRKLCIETVYPFVDILSMNEEELQYTLNEMYGMKIDIDDIESCIWGVEYLIQKFDVTYGIIVHTKDYAMYVGKPLKADIESGLMYGNILATAKASAGGYGTAEQIQEVLKLDLSPKGCEYREKIRNSEYRDRVILVPTRYIDKPKYTIGLGDSFTGGVQMCF